jgi:hypothetical protein
MNDTIVLALETFTAPIDSVPDLLRSTSARGARPSSPFRRPARRGVVSPIDPHRLIPGKGVSVIAKKKKAAKKKGKKKAKR